MAKRDPVRQEKLRVAIRYLLEQGSLAKGTQAQLARHFGVTRQRVHQLVQDERLRFRGESSAQTPVEAREGLGGRG